jgi:hypothetical protein
MEKKYIIKLEENEIAYKTVNSNGRPMIGLLHPSPYTEPDTEAAYAHGYSNAEIKYRAEVKEAYQKGLSHAWDAARKICAMDSRSRDEVFGEVITTTIFEHNPASEAIEKIRQYEQKQEKIKVGDEVINDEDIKGVTVDMDDYLLHVLDENGVIQAWPREDVVKTGRHFPEIAEVIKTMQEEEQ